MLCRNEIGSNQVPLQLRIRGLYQIIYSITKTVMNQLTGTILQIRMELIAPTIMESDGRRYLVWSMCIWTYHHQFKNSSFSPFQQLLAVNTPRTHCILDGVNIFIQPTKLAIWCFPFPHCFYLSRVSFKMEVIALQRVDNF